MLSLNINPNLFSLFLHHGSYFAQHYLDIKYKPAILELVVKDIYSKTIEL
ncbi:hypothetical protein P618_201028 [Holospora obtusa F1]|uniref:Uncharacterized protein n=1 Tax=Holospora obtusa F1 TaxID=1399147 RepID=W6TSD6_HOLOB|nr:hypothetical protein P618_201028 [Holospora obtusa F1]